MIVFDQPIAHVYSPLKVVLLSGLSDPSSCALSRSQRDFLDQLNVPSECKVYANFPYLPPDRTEQTRIPLLVASWRNLSQFRSASRSPFRDHAIAHWKSLVDSCRALFVITLSCGLEILNACLSTGTRPAEIDIVALGPVARSRPAVPHVLVRGSRDLVLNPWFRQVDVVLPGVGHMNYLANAGVLELVQSRMTELHRRLEDSVD